MSFFLNREYKNKSASSQSTDKKRYQPNLVSLMTLCANNYLLLSKLLADKISLNEQRHFFINKNLYYVTTINEITRYTSLITIEQKLPNKTNNLKITQLFSPKMTIRLYHDARMAEVLSSQDIQQVKPRYDYPNSQMHQQDEKQQINQFLNEWLVLCLDMGEVDVFLQY